MSIVNASTAIRLETPVGVAIDSRRVAVPLHGSARYLLNRDTFLQFEQFIPVLQRTIGKKRFLHSLGAMHYAIALADRHGEDLVRATAAGLFHDCGRLREIGQIEAETKRRGLTLPAEDRPFAKVWHAWLSAHMAKDDFAITDEAVLQAIRLHPTGDANMSRLDKIIFLADYMEPTRCFDGLKELRALAEEDLDGALRSALEHKLRYVQSLGRLLHPRSLRALAAAGGTLT